MSSPPVESPEAVCLPVPAWSGKRWLGLVSFVLAIQLGFIFALGDRQLRQPREVAPVKVWRAEDPLATLEDPTLFALPNVHGVAGLTWLKPPVVPFPPFRWTEPPRLLELRREGLGLIRPAAVSFTLGLGSELKPGAEPLPLLGEAALGAAPATNSSCQVAGALTGRRWLNSPALRTWPGTNLLAASVVQVLVDQGGDVASLALLPPGSGSREVDDYALQLARTARFVPGPPGGPPTLGQITFRWHTEPPPPAKP